MYTSQQQSLLTEQVLRLQLCNCFCNPCCMPEACGYSTVLLCTACGTAITRTAHANAISANSKLNEPARPDLKVTWSGCNMGYSIDNILFCIPELLRRASLT